jgi:phage replication-related protein YjqB (UPF0714/DUF867 family)
MAEAIISRLMELETDIQYQEYATETEPEYRYSAGTRPIMISAPHGAAHTRNGISKDEDEFTAGMARLLGERTSAHVLYSRRKSATDPNADPIAPYKKYLQEIIQKNQIEFVIDLHGAKDSSSFGIAVGTMHGTSCDEEQKQIIIKTLEDFGFSENNSGLFRLDVDNELPAMGTDTRVPITRFCHELSIPAIQIELNAWLRIPKRREGVATSKVPFDGKLDMIDKTLIALSEVVFSL